MSFDKEKMKKLFENFHLEKDEADKRRKEEFENDFPKCKLDKNFAITQAKIFDKNHELQKLIQQGGEVLCASEYYEKFELLSIPQPKTIIVEIEPWIIWTLTRHFDYKDSWMKKYREEATTALKEQLKNVNFDKFFFKTGVRSLKHSSYETLMFFNGIDDFLNKLDSIAESMFMNYDNDRYLSNQFVFREILELDYSVIRNGDMPLINEYRIFFEDGKIQYAIPYYSFDAFFGFTKYEKQHKNKKKEDIEKMYYSIVKIIPEDIDIIQGLINKISQAYKKGAVDILQDKNGKWWVVDIQPQRMSYGYNGIEENPEFGKNIYENLVKENNKKD